MTTVLQWATYLILGYFVVLNTGYVLLTALTYWAVFRYRRVLDIYSPEEALASEVLPPVTLVAPAYNEEATCVSSTRAFLSTDYPNFEVLVVNDGSSDATLERLRDAFELRPTTRPPTSSLSTEPVKQVYQSQIHPNLYVIDKENGGKADALNTGINFCNTPFFCAMDADTLIEGEGLARMVRPFLEEAATVAVGGIVRVANGCTIRSGRVQEVSMPRKWLPKLQVLEYLRAFYFGRVSWDALGAMLIISGAFGMFRRETVVDVGGYATDTVGEDMELVVRMHRRLREEKKDYRVRFIPDAVAWTEVPSTLRVLASQRDRWQRGLADSMIRHQRMLLNPRYGPVGLLAYPFFYALETFGPVLELTGYVLFVIALITGSLSGPFMVAFFLVAFMLGTALSLSAVALEELYFRRYEEGFDLAQLLFLPLIETFGYRQLNAWWRIKGLWSYLRSNEEWGVMKRAGFDSSDD
ncbi:glycosyltransferase family 2 protein [Salinibacter ruber]|uniref:glycosyltransferase family 2 protein n=1 Tax=Salinibacter ruber TaxID=146919 RepID=UPI00161230A4|nr:glycosyltransferase [Salinibacter ruber]MBB4090913.1 cellulose synthase/poly-beta-1,6-N-acetylglucosamine synthase-like glycosyltransferase [Salinibacter ruber]